MESKINDREEKLKELINYQNLVMNTANIRE
jgi:hypothetical protein